MHEVLELCAIIRVQTWDSDAGVPPKVEQALGLIWPQQTGAVATGGADVICTGSTDWLMMASDPDSVALLRVLGEAFEESAFRATDVSSSLVRIRISGSKARELLAKACALDLHPAAFLPGRCARTRFAGMPVIIRCTSNSTFECIVASSYRDYLTAWLTDAALEFAAAR
jgi:sarcosine oxidase subunit gamma